MRLLAIDPGCDASAYVVMDATYRPLAFAKVPNDDVFEVLRHRYDAVAIEMIASYGMAVGQEVFETCRWIGRFEQAAIANGNVVNFVFRKNVKLNLCGNPRAKDANIRQALVDRFAKHDRKNGKGTKDNPDWFNGFARDCWAAYAVGTTWMDEHNIDTDRTVAKVGGVFGG